MNYVKTTCICEKMWYKDCEINMATEIYKV